MKVFKITFVFTVLGVLSIAGAGIYKLNFVNDGIYFSEEPLYFIPSAGVWKDELGVCNTCTPENGFSYDGVVTADQGAVAWRQIFVSLKNDLDESPEADEVKDFFQNQYAEESGYYPVHVWESNDVFQVLIPVVGDLRNIDFFDRRGALFATYHVAENSGYEYLQDERALMAIAMKFARTSEIFQQDGYNLRIKNSHQSACERCFDFVFDHYGDPGVLYSLSVVVDGHNKAAWRE